MDAQYTKAIEIGREAGYDEGSNLEE